MAHILEAEEDVDLDSESINELLENPFWKLINMRILFFRKLFVDIDIYLSARIFG